MMRHRQAAFPAGWLRLGWIGPALILATQVAVALVLLIAAGGFVRTLWNLHHQQLGVRTEGALVVSALPRHFGRDGARMLRVLDLAPERLAAIPGVQVASASVFGLFAGTLPGNISVPGKEYLTPEETHVYWNLVSPGYFAATGMPLVGGRDFASSDSGRGTPVAVVNESAGRTYFGGANPIGKELIFKGRRVEIVGVVGDAKYRSLREPQLRCVYFPLRQDLGALEAVGTLWLTVRTTGDPRALVPSVRGELNRLDSELPILAVRTLEAQMDHSLAYERALTALSLVFGAVALVLVAIGLYSALSFVALTRTAELGLRAALGATPRLLRLELLRMGVTPVVIGVVLGVFVALPSMRLLDAWVYGVSATDLVTLLLGIATVCGLALFACVIPAHRAARVDPANALRVMQ